MMDAPHIFMDVSRLLSRARNPIPTGIDRVEYEYVHYLLHNEAYRLTFVAFHPVGIIGTLRMQAVRDFLHMMGQVWDGDIALRDRLPRMAQRLLQSVLLSHWTMPRYRGDSVYLLVSHHHLTRPQAIETFLSRHGSLFVPMVHDLIPMEFPEYARPGEPQRHARRMETVARLAAGVIVPAKAVARSLAPYVKGRPAEGHVHVVTHGLHLQLSQSPDGTPSRLPDDGRPYFVCLGTIEPRKNHLLLLNLWRTMAEEKGKDTPRLILVGRRGWENENVLDMLERCPALQGNVLEYNDLSDPEVVGLLQGSLGLLFPSFSEGFGLPLAEALVLGTPAICSDIPVFHEVAGADATYLDPTDGPAWRGAIDAMVAESLAHRGPARTARMNLFNWPRQVAAGIAVVDETAAFFRSDGRHGS
ncbi:glycosyltransferase family 4 protein [Komagataeibacter diospyri]|uniref:glycosyltransferase family 4 protein n=1 Tax=Komagataeibacter diospyri TaxID=1932662 RepID=UPI003756BD20